MKRLIAPFLLASALAGCAQPIAPIATVDDTVTAIATLDVRDSARRILETSSGLAPWAKADIDHLELELYKGTDSRPVATITVGQTDLAHDKTVKFTRLRMNSSYTIIAKAWADAAENTPIDNFDHDATSCTTTFSTTTVETVNIGGVNVKLRNKVFSGTSEAVAINVTDGSIESTTATEAITVNEPVVTINDPINIIGIPGI